MAFRSYDFECLECGEVHWDLVDVETGTEVPKAVWLECPNCLEMTHHDRIVSLVAPYMGEKNLSPPVYGGTYDTMGKRSLPDMEMLPNPAENASRGELKDHCDAYRARFASKEWKDLKKERTCIEKENKAKQKRAAAMARGETVNMRRDKLPGDPKVTA